MKIFRQHLPIALLATCVGIFLAHNFKVQGFIDNNEAYGMCRGSALTSQQVAGKSIGIQINGKWYVRVECADSDNF